MYSLDSLVVKFQEHAERADKSHREWVDAHKANNPGVPLPEHLADTFNLPRALGRICQEIMHLRDGTSS